MDGNCSNEDKLQLQLFNPEDNVTHTFLLNTDDYERAITGNIM